MKKRWMLGLMVCFFLVLSLGSVAWAEDGDAGKIAITSLKLSKTSASVVTGKTIELSYTALPSNHQEKVTWETTGSCTTVTQKGVVKGIRSGKDTITVRSEGGLSATCTVTVKAPATTSIKLPKTAKMIKGFKYTIPVTVKPKYAEPALIWKSSNTKVATVDKNGVFTAKAKGKTTITLKTKDGKLSTKCTVTVIDNSFSRSKPLYGKEKAVYVSTKRLYFKGDYLYVEIFVYNNTGRTVTKIDNAYLLLLDVRYDEDDMIIYDKYIGRWKPSGGSIRNKNYKVYSAKLPKKYFKGLDIGSGYIEAVLYADFYVKSPAAPRIIPLVKNGEQVSPKKH